MAKMPGGEDMLFFKNPEPGPYNLAGTRGLFYDHESSLCDDQVVVRPGVMHGLDREAGRFDHRFCFFYREPFLKWRAKVHRDIFPVKVDEPAGRPEHRFCVPDHLFRVREVMEIDAEEDDVGAAFAGDGRFRFLNFC